MTHGWVTSVPLQTSSKISLKAYCVYTWAKSSMKVIIVTYCSHLNWTLMLNCFDQVHHYLQFFLIIITNECVSHKKTQMPQPLLFHLTLRVEEWMSCIHQHWDPALQWRKLIFCSGIYHLLMMINVPGTTEQSNTQALWILNHFITLNDGCSLPIIKCHVTAYFLMLFIGIYEVSLLSGKWLFPVSCLYWCLTILGSSSVIGSEPASLWQTAHEVKLYICCVRMSRILNVSFPLSPLQADGKCSLNLPCL